MYSFGMLFVENFRSANLWSALNKTSKTVDVEPLNIGRKIHLVKIRFVLQIYDGQKFGVV